MKNKVFALFSLVCLMLFLGATNRMVGTNPYAGSNGEQGISLHVVDENILDDAFRIVNADTGFSPMAADTTIKVYYQGSDGDTAIVHILGIRPKRGAAADTFRTWKETIKVDGGDTVRTDSTYHAFLQAWADTGKGSPVLIWSSGQSKSIKRLRTLPARRIESPIAHWIFGNLDRPGISSIEVGVGQQRTSVLDSVLWSGGGRTVPIDTMVGDSDNDTSRTIPLSGIRSIALTWVRGVKDGSLAGGDYLFNATPQVSIDSTNWQSLDTVGIAAFTQTTSANATTAYQVLYNSVGDTVLARGRNVARINAARFLRFLLTHTVDSYIAGVSDTTFLALKMSRQYDPNGLGIAYELRVYPNIENAIQYTNDYYVLDRAYVVGPTGNKVFSWPKGLRLPPRTYLAVMAKGDVDKMNGYATIVAEAQAGR